MHRSVSRGGRVTLTAKVHTHSIVIRTADTGIRITAGALSHIFELLVRDASATDPTSNNAAGNKPH